MTRAIKLIAAMLCITCVLALCIAPWVDPPNTIFKSLQMLLLLTLSIAAAALLLAGMIPAGFHLLFKGRMRDWFDPVLHFVLPLEKNCVQQC